MPSPSGPTSNSFDASTSSRGQQPANARKPSPAVLHAQKRRRMLIATGGVIGVGLMASLVIAASLLRPALPVRVVAVGSHYAGNLALPHNADGWMSLERLCRAGDDQGFGHQDSLVRIADTPQQVDQTFDWQTALATFKRPTNLLVLSLHGDADEQGPYFLRSDCTDPAHADQALRLRTLLKELKKLPREQHKIVILDATRMAGDWHRGSLVNRFADGLRRLNDAVVAVPNLIVISASDVGEQSWPEIDGSGSLFLNEVVAGLQGQAVDRNQNGRLSMDELFASVQQNVKAKARSGRARSQSPILLPLGSEGLKRASTMEVALAAPAADDAHGEAAEVDQAKITKRWEIAAQLESTLDNPETTQTVAWRRYRRTLIRYEQLHLAKAVTLAKQVSDQLDDLEASLRRDASKTSGQLDPVQLATVDQGAAAEKIADKLLGQLWQTPAAKLPAFWKKSTAKLAPEQAPAVQRLLYDRLIDRASEKPLQNLPKAAEITRAIGNAERPRPSEAHYLVMLAQGLPGADLSLDLPEPGWPAALRLALETHRLSETMFEPDHASNQSLTPALLPWLRPRCEKADALRREGEDLLFGGADYLPQGTAILQQAKQKYIALKREAKSIRHAVRVRNHGFDRLPFYTDCLAAQRMTTRKSAEEIAPLLAACTAAWKETHKLGDMLLDADASTLSPDAMVASVGQQTTAVEAALSEVHDGLRAWRTDLLNRQGPAFANNRNAALLLPDLQIGERARFLAKHLVSHEGVRGSASSSPPTSNLAVRREAALRGQLAVAAIGERLYKTAHPTEPHYQQVTQSFAKAKDPHAQAYQDAARSLLQACNHLTRLVEPSQRMRMDVRLSPAKRSEIALAAAIIRRHERGDAASSAMTLLDRLRQRQKYDYSLWRANRVYNDRWNSLLPGAEPYYRLAASAYLRQAERAVAGQQAADALAKRVAKPFAIQIGLQSSTDIVSGVAPPCPYQIVADVALGAAILTATTSDGLLLQTPQAGARRVHRLNQGKEAAADSLIVSVQPQNLVPEEHDDHEETKHVEKLLANAWFRGHRASATTSVVIHQTPEIGINQPPRPLGAGLAVVVPSEFASRFGQSDGAVAFVLDASGSMGPAADEASSKYVEALQALRSMLSETPAGVQVSVWVFGQAMGPQKTVDRAEATVRQVLPPVVWRTGNEALIGRLMQKLAYPHVEPWNESPLTHAIVAAAGDLDKVAGFKTVVAITDGVDNRFAEDPIANPNRKPIAEVLRANMAAQQIALHVVGFRVAGAEKQKARQQFAFLDRLSPPGKWWEAEQAAQLEQTLRSALSYRPRLPLTLFDSKGNKHQIQSAVASHSSTATSDQPLVEHQSLPAGNYTVSLPTKNRSQKPQRLTLENGDLLLLSLQDSVSGATLVPKSYTANYLPEKPTQSVPGWRTTLLNNRTLPSGATSTLVGIESQRLTGTTLRQVRPQDVWFELKPAAGAPPKSHAAMSIQPVYGYPMPCWELRQQPSHDSSSSPTSLTAWWTPKGSTNAAYSLRARGDFQSLSDLVGRTWEVDGESVTLNRLAVETRTLPNAAGKPVEQGCLVVELGGAPLCRVGVHGLSATGSQHQYFQQAERYVGLFWPVDTAQINQQLKRFELVSIQQLKKQAEQQGTMVRFSEIAPANGEDRRPLPAVDWLGSNQP